MTKNIGVGTWLYHQNDMFARRGVEGWKRRLIVAETSRSWVVAPHWIKSVEDYEEQVRRGARWIATNSTKLQEKGFEWRGWARSPEEIKDIEWAHSNSHRIGDMVGRSRDVEKLRQIADIIGYKERTEEKQ